MKVTLRDGKEIRTYRNSNIVVVNLPEGKALSILTGPTENDIVNVPITEVFQIEDN